MNKIIQALQTVTKLTEICLNNFRHLNRMSVIRMYFIKRAFMLLTNRLCDTLIAAKKDKRALLMKICKVNVFAGKDVAFALAEKVIQQFLLCIMSETSEMRIN